ncbi:MAG: tetratricopeptide repeat protein [Candidatus Peregrinibacteria bacterium]
MRTPKEKKRIVPQYSRKVMRELAKSEEFKVRGKHEQALEVAQKILEKDPACVAAAEEIADNLLSMNNHKAAEKAARFVLSLDPKSYISNYTLGFLALTKGDDPQALPYLFAANEAAPNNPEILRCLGWSLFHTGARIEGIATLERALNLRPDDSMILCDLGVCCLHLNFFEKTIRLFERALALDPESARAKECLDAAKGLRDQAIKDQEGKGGQPA